MTSLEIYSTNGCPQCGAVKRWLTERGIVYSETNVSLLQESEADEIRKELKADGYMGAPVVYFTHNGETTHFKGFNPGKLEEIETKLKAAA